MTAMELIEMRSLFEDLSQKSADLRRFVGVEGKQNRLRELEAALADPGIWDQPRKSAPMMKEKKALESTLAESEHLARGVEELATYFELIEEDPSLATELEQELLRFSEFVEEAELHNYLSGDLDRGNAYLSIHAGAGGTESQDWAEMLLRMFLRFGERMSFRCDTEEVSPGEEAGIKSVTVRVEGEYAYGYLRQEIGVHRLVRISPFDANSRRHTSFAAVFVYPEVDDSVDIVIDPKELRIDTFRAGGAGGQHVNRTESAIRITHLPTNIVAQCQNERSQHQNKDRAMQILRAKIYDHEMKIRNAEKDRLENEKGDIAWGNQIRSYVLHPYQSIKDHRTGVESGNSQKVLDGDIFPFIKAALKGTVRQRG